MSPLDFSPSEKVRNPVLTGKSFSDVQAVFVADPFMIRHDGTWHMFMEVMNGRTERGEIGVAVSKDAFTWKALQIVLAEPFHLSYPYVFEWQNEYYMIPETRQANSVRLYRALDFPTKWSFVGALLEGPGYVDPSIFHANDRWWLFTGQGCAPHWGDTLRLFHAPKLTGPWFEHPKSPLIEGNPRAARPAGRVLMVGEKIFRYAQDCYPVYGSQVRAFEILELTTTSYREREIEDKSPVLRGSRVGWNAAGMHHIDAHALHNGNWIACVDGFFWQTSEAALKQPGKSAR